MQDFSHLDKLQPKQDRVRNYTFHEIEGAPTLQVVHAGESNKPYFNSVLKSSKAKVRRIRAGGIGPEVLAERRAEDRLLFSHHAVRSWNDSTGQVSMRDAKNAQVPFSQQSCHEFLLALPDWLFDRFRDYLCDPSNFTDDEAMPPAEVDDLSKG